MTNDIGPNEYYQLYGESDRQFGGPPVPPELDRNRAGTGWTAQDAKRDFPAADLLHDQAARALARYQELEAAEAEKSGKKSTKSKASA